jgi:hypothetical protein
MFHSFTVARKMFAPSFFYDWKNPMLAEVLTRSPYLGFCGL